MNNHWSLTQLLQDCRREGISIDFGYDNGKRYQVNLADPTGPPVPGTETQGPSGYWAHVGGYMEDDGAGKSVLHERIGGAVDAAWDMYDKTIEERKHASTHN